MNQHGGRGDEFRRVTFHSDRGSVYAADSFTKLWRYLGVCQSMGRVGSCVDNAAAEAFFSSLGWEVPSPHQFKTARQTKAVVLDWCYEFYNHERRLGSAGIMSPVRYENTAASDREAAWRSPPRPGGESYMRCHHLDISIRGKRRFDPVRSMCPYRTRCPKLRHGRAH